MLLNPSIAFWVEKSVSFIFCPWIYFGPKVIETALVFGDVSKDVLILKWVDMLKSIFMERLFQLFWKWLVKKCSERRQKKLLKQQPKTVATKTGEHAGEKAGDKIIQLLIKKNKNTITPSIASPIENPQTRELRAAFRKYRPTIGTSSKFDFAHFWLIDKTIKWVIKHAVVSFPK